MAAAAQFAVSVSCDQAGAAAWDTEWALVLSRDATSGRIEDNVTGNWPGQRVSGVVSGCQVVTERGL